MESLGHFQAYLFRRCTRNDEKPKMDESKLFFKFPSVEKPIQKLFIPWKQQKIEERLQLALFKNSISLGPTSST